MRRGAGAAVMIAGVAGTLALGAGLVAWAGWMVPASIGRGTAVTEKLPRAGRSSTDVTSKEVTISWPRGSGRAVGGYVVTRIAGDARKIVCEVPAETLTCVDEKPPKGKEGFSYVVHATAGTRWTGPESEPVLVRRTTEDDGEASPPKARPPATNTAPDAPATTEPAPPPAPSPSPSTLSQSASGSAAPGPSTPDEQPPGSGCATCSDQAR